MSETNTAAETAAETSAPKVVAEVTATAPETTPANVRKKAKTALRENDEYVILFECTELIVAEQPSSGSIIVDWRAGYGEGPNVLRDILSEPLGYSQVRQLGMRWPLELLIKYWSLISETIRNYNYKMPKGLVEIINEHSARRIEQFEKQIGAGVIEFEALDAYFLRGKEVLVTNFSGQELGGKIVSTAFVSSWSGNYFNVKVETIVAINARVERGFVSARIPAYAGTVQLERLNVQLLTDESRKRLSERGEVFRRVTNGAAHMQYNGIIFQPGYWSSTSYNASGRVIVDAATMNTVDSDLSSQIRRIRGIEVADDESEFNDEFALTDDLLWQTFPFVYGFSFTAKQWGEMQVGNISEITWRTDAWDKLVLDDDSKEIVQALVEHHGTSFSDIVEEKGGGVIFMLSGPPGEGKTLTMETIAEYLKRPLYRVSVGELGVNPDQLEERLRKILDIATVWDAVVGLDEADIFLAAREKNDVLRNAMVGVFLRLTEYHQGVLFLTTNLIDNIDAAFESRISVHMSFEKSTTEKRVKIWRNLLAAANVPENTVNIENLAIHPFNGRQIKNIIRQTQTLAKARGVEFNAAVVADVIRVTSKR